MRNEEWIGVELKAQQAAGLTRSLATQPRTGATWTLAGGDILNLSSNDYLGLARHPRVIEGARRALEQYGAGATASRLVVGTLPLHDELEQRLARLKQYPSALVFGSGYLTNAGAITTLVGRDDLVLADRLAHASLLDAMILSGARRLRFRHNDPDHVDEVLKHNPARRRLIVTESVFSMDGDFAPLRELSDLAARYDAMMLVDEAHATGLFGPGGAGRISELGLADQMNVSMGTLSKALGTYGGFVACSTALRDLMIGRARSFIYTTALPPAAAGAALAALDLLEECPDLGRQVLDRARTFRERLVAGGLNTLNSCSPIIPVLVGENEKALSFSRRLREAGLLAVAIRPPTVPPGTARLRFSVTLAHTPAALEHAADTILALAREAQLC